MEGTVREVSEEFVVLAAESRINNVVRTYTKKVHWCDVTMRSHDDLARRGGWEPAEEDLAVVREYVRARAEGRPVDLGDSHPLAGYLRRALSLSRRPGGGE